MNKSNKYQLHLSGDMLEGFNSLTIFNNSSLGDPELFLKSLDDVLNMCEVITDNPEEIISNFNSKYFDGINFFEEEITDKTSTLLNVFFKASKQNYINKKSWEAIKLLANISSPELKTTVIPFSHEDGEVYTIKTIYSDNRIESFSTMIEDDIALSYDYYCNSSKDLLIATLDTIFRNKETSVVKRCENCNKLYIAKKLDTKYCDRISPQMDNRTCKQAVDYEKKNNALKDPIKKLIKNVSNTLSGIYANSKSKEDKKTLESFKRENAIKLKKYNDGELDIAEYEKWLRSFYKRS